MSNKVLNVAIVGSGSISDRHIAGIQEQPNCRLYALCDNATDGRLERRTAKYGPDIAVKDYRELLDDPKVDMVIVATSDYSHCEITCAFLRAGKPVLLEKPMALNTAECEEMLACEKETGTRLMVGQVCRYNPIFAKAKALVDEGAIGELVFVESEYAHDYMNVKGYDSWRVDARREGMIGGGCHAVDFLRWVAGNPTEVSAYSNHKYLVDWPANDTTIAIYKFPNNVIGKVFCSIGVKRDYTMRTCLYGTEGTIIFESRGEEIKLYQVDKNGKNYTFPKLMPCRSEGHNMSGEIKDFAEAILQDKPNPIRALEGASTIAVCCATVEAAKLGHPVQIKYPEV